VVTAESEEGGGKLSVRLLVVALVAQVVLFGGLIVVAVNGFPCIGCGADKHEVPAATAAAVVPAARVNRFDGRGAMRLVRLQLGYGQRPAGSPQLRRAAERLRRKLPNGRFEPVPGSDPARPLRNIVGSIPGTGPVVVLGAHYDTETHPKGFVGANDSAAGTAAVIEAARALSKAKRPAGAPEIRFVLFDGEEEPHPTTNFYRDALRGSKAYVQEHAEEVGSMVLLDYIANKGVRLPREASSDRALWDKVRASARRVGVSPVFPDATETAIFDDHTPFLRAGIPAVDLIDWTYRYRDTVRDSYDKLSERSIDAVGETIVDLLRTWR
jgi:glutaminyl-peptide cyclotransferase